MHILSPFETLGSSEGFFLIFRTGLFHGFFFSLPFSIPMLICFRRYLLDGFSLGNYAFAGTLLGHLSFVFCILEGIRPIIYFWYPFEPLLSLLGLALSLKVATDFFSQRRFVFETTEGFSEDYALNPWPTIPKISWENLTGSPLPRPIDRILQKILFFWDDFMERATDICPKPVLMIFEKIQNFLETNLGPSIFSFQFFLMWLNPASPSTFNLLFFEHEILPRFQGFQGMLGYSSQQNLHLPLFLFYTLGFVFSAGVFSTLLLWMLSDFAGRSFDWRLGTPRVLRASIQQDQQPTKLNTFRGWLEKFTDFDEALAQKRLKILNQFFTFLIVGCLIQSGLNCSWRLFLQYPLELIHWDFLNPQKFLSRLSQLSWLPPSLRLSGETSEQNGSTSLTKPGEVGLLMTAPKEVFQSGPVASLNNVSEMGLSTNQKVDDTELNVFDPSLATWLAAANETSSLRTSSASLPGDLSKSWPQLNNHLMAFRSPAEFAVDFFKNHTPSELNEISLKEGPDFLTQRWVQNLNEFLNPKLRITEPASPASSSEESERFRYFGKREFPPYDTSIRNRDKSLPVERHLPIERVNSRRALMGRPPLENEERENAIFKYHTFFMNQIDRTVGDFKMNLRTPKDLYREDDDILALEKLHENYLKQKGRQSPYQKSFQDQMKLARNSSKPRPSASKAGIRHDRDFFTKSRPVKNTTKGLVNSSYIRDLFDENPQEAYSSYLHDDLLLDKFLNK